MLTNPQPARPPVLRPSSPADAPSLRRVGVDGVEKLNSAVVVDAEGRPRTGPDAQGFYWGEAPIGATGVRIELVPGVDGEELGNGGEQEKKDVALRLEQAACEREYCARVRAGMAPEEAQRLWEERLDRMYRLQRRGKYRDVA